MADFILRAIGSQREFKNGKASWPASFHGRSLCRQHAGQHGEGVIMEEGHDDNLRKQSLCFYCPWEGDSAGMGSAGRKPALDTSTEWDSQLPLQYLHT